MPRETEVKDATRLPFLQLLNNKYFICWRGKKRLEEICGIPLFWPVSAQASHVLYKISGYLLWTCSLHELRYRKQRGMNLFVGISYLTDAKCLTHYLWARFPDNINQPNWVPWKKIKPVNSLCALKQLLTKKCVCTLLHNYSDLVSVGSQ